MTSSAAHTFLGSILGGMSISFGGMAFISVPNPFLGSFLFSIGLLSVCHFRWGLYTGRVHNLVDVSIPAKKTVPDLINVYLGNLLGALFVGYLIYFSGKHETILCVQEIVQYKLSLPLLKVLVLSFFCGIMVYVAVIGFRKIEDPVGKHLAIVMPVMVFIVSGYEHSIADLFYISAANAWGLSAVAFSAVAAIGNLLGGCFVPVFDRLCNLLK
jgi:formate/nitrite transporter FocA (FNT family)